MKLEIKLDLLENVRKIKHDLLTNLRRHLPKSPAADPLPVAEPLFGHTMAGTLAVILLVATLLLLASYLRDSLRHSENTEGAATSPAAPATSPSAPPIVPKPQTPHKICIVGSGNWGSAIARVVGLNAAVHPMLDETVNMWVYEEKIEGNKLLTEVINTTHVNVKYLPNTRLPPNVVAVPELIKAAEGATLLVFVLPHQFLSRLCPQIIPVVAPGCHAISLIKGVEFEAGSPRLISSLISSHLGGMDVAVLMGANVANEVARDEFCEATVGCAHPAAGQTWRTCFHRTSFNVSVVRDVAGVELCGALKNVVALGAGFCDGLGFGANTKAAIVRLGLREMHAFAALFFAGVDAQTFFESCGMADLITTCYGGRNRKCAEAFARRGRGAQWEAIEAELLNGQKLQGTLTCQDVHACLVARGPDAQARFPLLEAVYAISFEERDPVTIIQLTSDR